MTLKVLMVVHAWPPEQAGGTGLVVGNLATALQAQGVEVTVAHPGPGGGSVWRGVAVEGVPVPRGLGWAAGWRHSTHAARELLDRLQPDVVDIHHLSGWPLSLPLLARAQGARVVMTLHDYSVVCARGQLVNRAGQVCPGPSTQRCSRCLAPFLGVRARLMDAPSRRDRDAVADRLRLARTVMEAADVRLAPSHDLARRYRRLGSGPVEHCPLPSSLRISPAPPPGNGPVRFLFCSSLIPTKGPQQLVEAFARLPEGRATLTVAGPCPPFPADPGFGARLRRRIEATPDAAWLPPVPHSEVPQLLHAHDVLALPSVWPENSPLIVREACAAGLRTIVSVQGGSGELDPLGRRVDMQGDGAGDRLYDALLAESEIGRGRRPCVRWPTPASCANWLTETVYTSGPTTIGLPTD